MLFSGNYSKLEAAVTTLAAGCGSDACTLLRNCCGCATHWEGIVDQLPRIDIAIHTGSKHLYYKRNGGELSSCTSVGRLGGACGKRAD